MSLEQREGDELNGFALILVNNRTWGSMLVPVIMESEPDQCFWSVSEFLSPWPRPEILGTLSSEAREIVKLSNDYSEKNLHRLFSKEPNTKQFISELTKERISEIIRPYIETKTIKILRIAHDEGIPVFIQKIKSGNFHTDDLLTVHLENIETLFRFNRSAEGTVYTLSLFHEGEEVKLDRGDSEIMVNSPAVIRNRQGIYVIYDLEATRLKPFFSKSEIAISPAIEKKYFRSFVLDAVTNHNVDALGFSIETADPAKRAILTIEEGIRGLPVAILHYSYSDTVIKSDDKRATFTRFTDDNGRYIFVKLNRDLPWEEECRAILGDYGFFSDDNINFMLYTSDDGIKSDILTLVEKISLIREDLVRAGFEVRKGSLEVNYNLEPVNIIADYQINNDWFDLKAEVIIGEFTIPFIRLRNNIINRERLFKLPDGSFAVLPERWFEIYKNIFSFGKKSDDLIKIHKQHFPLISEAFSSEKNADHKDLEQLVMPEKLPFTPLPKSLKAEMRAYQEEGYRWLLFLRENRLGGCLADDMGLGKTLQVLALLLNSKESPELLHDNNYFNQQKKEQTSHQTLLFPDISSPILTSLVIVPASLLHNWESEIRRYAPALSVCTYKGTTRKKETSYFRDFDIILSSYHTVRQDIDIISEFCFHYTILDESQVIKNPASAVYKAISRLNSDHKLVLTGTPVENSLTDLWTQLNFVNPGLLGSLLYFKNEFTKPVERESDQQQEERLKTIIKPFILRRTKEMVARELPPVWEQTVYCDMTDEQYEIYDREKSAIRNRIMNSLAGSASNSAIMILQGLMKLRQVSNHPVMINEDYEGGSGKFDIVMHDIRSLTSKNHKILIFSSFVKHLNLYAEAMRQEGIKFSMLTGSTVNREAVVNEFINDKSRKVFLISLKAGGVGLNLTVADYVFILDPWWNPAVEMQALNRAHRIGQDKKVIVFRYLSADSIEEKIVTLQERKSKIAETFISSNNPLKDMEMNEILEIIG